MLRGGHLLLEQMRGLLGMQGDVEGSLYTGSPNDPCPLAPMFPAD